MAKEIKVMVVDDSAVVRKIMSAILDRDPDIRVIGTASSERCNLRMLPLQRSKRWDSAAVRFGRG